MAFCRGRWRTDGSSIYCEGPDDEHRLLVHFHQSWTGLDFFRLNGRMDEKLAIVGITWELES
jgi:hypothetical protein